MIEELFYIEKSAYRDSFVHQLDARVKIIGMFAVIIAMVAIPYSPSVLTIGILFLAFLAALWALTGLPWLIYAKRLLMVLPFGLFIIIFQIFFTNRYYQVFHVIADLPFGSYEQGERVYTSMLCRGYGRHSFLYVKKKPLGRSDLAFLSVSIIFVIAVPVIFWLTAIRIF